MWAAPAEELSQPAAPPCPRSRSLRVGRCRVRPVARRSLSRNSGGPTGTGTRPSPSSRAMTLPCSPWEAGKHPVASEAEFTRVAEGKTDRWWGYHRALVASRYRFGVNASPTRSPRNPSTTTRTARRSDGMGCRPVTGDSGGAGAHRRLPGRLDLSDPEIVK